MIDTFLLGKSQDSDPAGAAFNIRGYGLTRGVSNQADIVATQQFLEKIEEIGVKRSRTGYLPNEVPDSEGCGIDIERMEEYLDKASQDDGKGSSLRDIQQTQLEKWDEQARKLGLQDFQELVKMHKLYKFSRQQPDTDGFSKLAAREATRSRNELMARARTADGVDHNMSRLTGLI